MVRMYGDRRSDYLLNFSAWRRATEGCWGDPRVREREILKAKAWVTSLVLLCLVMGIGFLAGMLNAGIVLWATLVFSLPLIIPAVLWILEVAVRMRRDQKRMPW